MESKVHVLITTLYVVFGSNTTTQNRVVRRGLSPLINTCSSHLSSNVGLFNTLSRPTRLGLVQQQQQQPSLISLSGVRYMDQITPVFYHNPTIVVEPITTPENRLVRWGLLPHINTCLGHLSSNLELFNNMKQ